MRWFKHQTASHEDPDISDAWDEFGDAGYSVFFVTLEIYGREFKNIDEDGWLTLSRKYYQKKLRRKWKVSENILAFYSERGRILWECSENVVKLKIPKFIELASTWSGRANRKPTQVPTEAPTQAPTAPRSRSRSRTRSRKDLKPLVYECDFFKIDAKTHETYRAAFVDVDLMEQYKKMAAWLASRPGAEYGQIMVFVYEWLKNEQSSGTAFQQLGDALRGTGAKGMPKEAHAKPRARYEPPETLEARCKRKVREGKGDDGCHEEN